MTAIDGMHETSAGADGGAKRFAPPPRQRPYETAISTAFAALRALAWTPERCERLGAEVCADGIRLPALNRHLLARPEHEDVLVEGAGPARHDWAILALHYLGAVELTPDAREMTLSHFADARGYLDVYNRRIIGRFLKSCGASDAVFCERAERVGGERVPWNGTCYRFTLFPRVPLTVVRYDGDDEYPPGANIIYRADAAHLLPAEDRIVAAEVLLNMLSGVPMHDEHPT